MLNTEQFATGLARMLRQFVEDEAGKGRPVDAGALFAMAAGWAHEFPAAREDFDSIRQAIRAGEDAQRKRRHDELMKRIRER